MVVALSLNGAGLAQSPWSIETKPNTSIQDNQSRPIRSPWSRSESFQSQQRLYEVQNLSGTKSALSKQPDLTQTRDSSLGHLDNQTRIEVLETVPDRRIPSVRWYRVRVLEGTYKGITGYVSASNVRIIRDSGKYTSTPADRFTSRVIDQRAISRPTDASEGKPGYTMKNSALILTEPDISKASLKERQLGMAVNGTRLELLEVKPDPTVAPMKWFHVRLLDGELSGRTGYVSATNVREDGSASAPESQPSRSTSSNESIHSKTTNQAEQYVLKTGALIVAEPKIASASEKSKQVGFAVTGTSLQFLDQTPTLDGVMSWRRVRVLSGDMKGSEGWVTANSLRKSFNIYYPIGAKLLNTIIDPDIPSHDPLIYGPLLSEDELQPYFVRNDQKIPIRQNCRAGYDYVDGDKPFDNITENNIPERVVSYFHKIDRFSDAELVADLERFYSWIIDRSSMALVRDLLRHLMSGAKTDYIHEPGSILSNKLRSLRKFQNERDRVSKYLEDKIRKHADSGKLDLLRIAVPAVRLSVTDILWDGPLLAGLIGGIQGTEIYLIDITFPTCPSQGCEVGPTRKLEYNAKLRFDYCDDYGVSWEDWNVGSWVPKLPLEKLFVLHHQRSARSFTNVIRIEEEFAGSFVVPKGYDYVKPVAQPVAP